MEDFHPWSELGPKKPKYNLQHKSLYLERSIYCLLFIWFEISWMHNCTLNLSRAFMIISCWVEFKLLIATYTFKRSFSSMNYHMLFEVLFCFESVATFSALVRSLSSVGPHVSYQTHFLMEWFFTECASIPKRPASMDSLASSPSPSSFVFFPTMWAHIRPVWIFGQLWPCSLWNLWQCQTRVVCRKPEKGFKICFFGSR